MSYLARQTIYLNGVQHQRGEIFSGADAVAIDKNPLLRAKCVRIADPAPAVSNKPVAVTSQPPAKE